MDGKDVLWVLAALERERGPLDVRWIGDAKKELDAGTH